MVQRMVKVHEQYGAIPKFPTKYSKAPISLVRFVNTRSNLSTSARNEFVQTSFSWPANTYVYFYKEPNVIFDDYRTMFRISRLSCLMQLKHNQQVLTSSHGIATNVQSNIRPDVNNSNLASSSQLPQV